MPSCIRTPEQSQSPEIQTVIYPVLPHAEPVKAAFWELANTPAVSAEALTETIGSLCKNVLWMRSWWRAYGDTVRAADARAAAEINDRFVDGAILADSVASLLGVPVDNQRINNYRWGNSAQALRVFVPGQQAPVQQGGAK